MLIIAYPRDDGFFERAPFKYRLDPKMAKIDELLEDDRLILRASVDLAQSAPGALETGRPATPVEVSVRLAVLRRLKGWSYRQVEDEVKGSLKWRGFCRIYDHPVPDHDTIQTREALISPATLHDLNDLLAQRAVAEGVTHAQKLRTDSSVVETHIHYPTDSSLLADGVRVLGRSVARARSVIDGRTLRGQPALFSNHQRQARRLAREIATHARRQSHKKAKQTADSERKLQHLYRDLIGVADHSLAAAHQVHTLLGTRGKGVKALALAATLAHFIPLLQRVIAQARRRVLDAQHVPAPEKLVSLFEPHTAIIQRGKTPPRDTEFGRKVWYAEVDGGIVSEYRLLPGNPPDNQDQWATSLKHHRHLFGHPPRTATGDRGVYSSHNEALARQAKVKEPALPKPGAKTPERQAYEAQPWFKAALRFRAGIEGRISVLHGPRGLRRCLNRGESGLERWVGWGVITNNLVVMATALTRRRRRRSATA